MQLKFETLNPEETYSEGDLKFDLTCLMADFLRKRLKDKPEAKENALQRLCAFIRMTSSQGLYYQSCLQENIHWLHKKPKSLHKIHLLLVELLNNPDDEIKLFAFDGLLSIVSEAQDNYHPRLIKKCINLYFDSFEKIVDLHRSKARSLSRTHNRLINLLQHNHPEIRLFAAQAILTAVYQSYLVTFIFNKDNYPFAELEAIFLPELLEQLNDPNLEIRKWIACSLCYFDINGHFEPQRVISYAENVLESNNPAWQQISIMALTRLPFKHPCFLSPAAVSRLVHLCLGPSLLDPWDRNEVLRLLSLQVQYNRLTHSVEIIEQCLQFPEVADTDLDDKKMLAETLLELIAINYHPSCTELCLSYSR